MKIMNVKSQQPTKSQNPVPHFVMVTLFSAIRYILLPNFRKSIIFSTFVIPKVKLKNGE